MYHCVLQAMTSFIKVKLINLKLMGLISVICRVHSSFKLQENKLKLLNFICV
ncbi:unnamed protein product [Tenebrio molitor]|nr:unnamed protein product [Tenebrio molitor]